MTLIVEDGTIIANANAYVDVAFVDAYAIAVNNSDWTALSTEDKEGAIIYATSWIDTSYKWNSAILDTSQSLCWPVVEFTDDKGRTEGGAGVIPTALKNAVSEMAINYADHTFNQPEGNIKKEKIFDSETEFRGSKSTKYDYVGGIIIFLGVKRSTGRIWQ